MRRVLVVLALVAACEKAKSPPAAGRGSAVVAPVPADAAPAVSANVARLTAYADAMCACADSACIDRVENELVAWTVDQANAGTLPNMTPADVAMVGPLHERAVACSAAVVAKEAAARPIRPGADLGVEPCFELEHHIAAIRACAKAPAGLKETIERVAATPLAAKDTSGCAAVVTLVEKQAKAIGCDLYPPAGP